jgi:hypothetical protein
MVIGLMVIVPNPQSAIRNPQSAIRNPQSLDGYWVNGYWLLSAIHIRHPKSAIPHPTSHIAHRTSHIPHPTSAIPHPTSLNPLHHLNKILINQSRFKPVDDYQRKEKEKEKIQIGG